MATVLTAEEARVVGSLAEKHLTTPQYYPLTHNALLNACNQSNNRDPVVTYDDATVDAALASLREKGFARVVHPGAGSRVTKFRHVLDEALGLDRKELALICVLLLRGPQTLNELRTRTERMADFDDAAAVERDLGRLSEREPPLVQNVGRRAGQREERFATTLAPTPDDSQAASRPRARPVRLTEARIPPLSAAEASDEQRELMAASGLDAGNLFGTFARHPGLLRRWLPFGASLLVNGTLAPRLRELAILRTAYLCGSVYEWGQHVTMAGQAGLSVDEIERVARGPEGWDDLEGAVIHACDDIHAAGMIAEATWSRLAAGLDEIQLIELPMLIGHYRMLAVTLASLGVQPEPGMPELPDT